MGLSPCTECLQSFEKVVLATHCEELELLASLLEDRVLLVVTSKGGRELPGQHAWMRNKQGTRGDSHLESLNLVLTVLVQSAGNGKRKMLHITSGATTQIHHI